MNENFSSQTDPSTQEPSKSTPPTDTTFEQFLHEAGQVLVEVLQAAGKGAEDLTGLMVVNTNAEMRQNLDVLVESGAAKNRAEALKTLLHDGVHANHAVYENVERTRQQIAMLRDQLRNLVQQM